MLGVKPILALDRDGRVVPLGKAIGRERVLPALMDAMAKEIPPDAHNVRFGIIHVGRPEIVDQASAEIRARFGDVEILSAPATPVIATHLGSGAWGAGYMVED